MAKAFSISSAHSRLAELVGRTDASKDGSRTACVMETPTVALSIFCYCRHPLSQSATTISREHAPFRPPKGKTRKVSLLVDYLSSLFLGGTFWPLFGHQRKKYLFIRFQKALKYLSQGGWSKT